MRSIWKNFFINNKIFNKKKKIPILDRNNTILASMVGNTFLVHNGKEFKTIYIESKDYIGHKLGEFSSTKVKSVYFNKRKQKYSKKFRLKIKKIK